MDDIEHLRTELKMLGNQHKKWREKIPILQDRVRRAHAAGMTQTEIVALSGYERDNVRLLCMDPGKREAMRARRRRLNEEKYFAAVNTPPVGSLKPERTRSQPVRPDDDLVGNALDANADLVEQMERTAADTGARVKRGRPKRK